MAGSANVESKSNEKLDFTRITFCGRRGELEQLCADFSAAISSLEESPDKNSTRARSVIIESPAGGGKTTLMNEFLQEAVSDRNIIVCRGKFEDRTVATEPFSAIIDAINGLVEVLKLDRLLWQQRIETALKTETIFIQEIIPSLKTILGNTDSQRRCFSANTSGAFMTSSIDFDRLGSLADKEWGFERFRFAVRALLRNVSCHVPVLLLLDDLQWAEPDSVSIINTLIDDTYPGRKFFFLGASRPLTNYNRFSNFIETGERRLKIVRMTSWNAQSISRVLSQLTSLDIDSVEELADEIFRKTGGNCFGTVQFIRTLEKKGLVFFSSSKNRWIWDLSKITKEPNMSNSAMEAVANTLRSFDEGKMLALTAAASFGASQFEVETIVHAATFLKQEKGEGRMQCETGIDETTDFMLVRQNIHLMSDQLRSASKLGLVEQIGSGTFRFAHDSVREAAYKLLPDGNARKKLHLTIGRQLHSWMDTQEERGGAYSQDSLLLNAANQLNQAADLITDRWEKRDLADLNYLAAEIAAKRFAFFTATSYLTQGLSHLGAKRWEEYYDATIKLSVALTRIKYCSGLHSECLEVADEVIKRGRTFLDKRAIFHTKLQCLMQTGRMDEASELCLSILSDLGSPFPKRLVWAKSLRESKKMLQRLKTVSDANLLTLDEADDENLNARVEFMERLCEIEVHKGNADYLGLIGSRFIADLLDHGRHPMISFSFTMWSFALVCIEKYDDAWRFAKLALASATKSSIVLAARMHTIVYFYIYHWRMPARDALDPFACALNDFRLCGKLEYFTMDAGLRLRLAFVCGEPLFDLSKECIEYLEMLADYKRMLSWKINAPLHFAILNFIGETSVNEPALLKVDWLDQVNGLTEWNSKISHWRILFHFHFFSLILGVFFGRFDLALSSLHELPPWNKAMSGLLEPCRLFFAGLVYFNSKKSGYRQKGKAAVKRLRKLADEGAVNCRHMYMILKAEALASSWANVNSVRTAYDNAIDAAAELGVCHHEALANERAGLYLANKAKQPEASLIYLARAMRLYEKWGAMAKLKDVESIYDGLKKVTSDSIQ